MKKILKVALVLMMAFGIQLASLNGVSAQENGTLPDGSYIVSTVLKNASNINNDSMAAGALADEGTLEIIDGKWYLIAEFKTLSMFGFSGNASNIKYYETDTNSSLNDAEVISYRTDASGAQQVEKVKIPVAVDSEGVYIQMYVDVMMMTTNSYIQFNTDGIIIPKPEPENPVYNLENGKYEVDVDILKTDSDDQSMAAQAVKSAVVEANGGKLVVTLEMGSVTVYGQTAYVDNMEYQLADGTYKIAEVTDYDSDGNVSQIKFTLDKNTKYTNVKFYYGGSSRGAEARLSLGLDNPVLVEDDKETSKFSKDGTYNVKVALWNATQDKASMAAEAVDEMATVVVKDGVKTMYLTTKKMSFASLEAALQELYIGSTSDSNYKDNMATVEARDNEGNPVLWSFALPSEEEFFNVVVNPHVAMMGNGDIDARIKVDYSTLTYVSASTEAPVVKGDDNQPTTDDSKTDTTVPATDNNTTSSNSTAVKTGDNTSIELMGGLLIVSLVTMGYLVRRKLWQ